MKPLIPSPKGRYGGVVEVVVIVALAIGLALAIQAWLIKPYQNSLQSMEPTLRTGQRVLVNRFVYYFSDPAIGDIIVFHPPTGADDGSVCGVPNPENEPCPESTGVELTERNFIKRIVAGPGDTFSIKGGHPVVNGKWMKDEPYINPCGSAPSCNMPRTITIPPDHYFMLGDNRGASSDSRFWGPIARDWIMGKVFFTYWPPDRWGFM